MIFRRFSPSNLFVFFLLWVCFAYFYQGGFDNQNSRFDYSLALAFDHRLSIDSFHENTIDKAAIDGHYYLEKSPVVSYLTLPVAWVGSIFWTTEDLQAQHWRGDILLYFAGILILAPLSAGAGVCFRQLLRVLNPTLSEGKATLLAVLVFLCTLAWPYSTMLFGHQVAASLLIVGLYLGLTEARTKLLSYFRMAAAFALLGLAVCTEYPTAILAASCALIILFRARRRGMVMLVGAACALLPFVLLLLHNWMIFGSPWALGYGKLQGSRFGAGMSTGLYGVALPSWPNALQLLFGPYRGLFFYSPLLLIGCAAYALWPRRAFLQVAIPSIVASFGLVLIISGYSYWQGGVCFGPRHLVPSIPLIALGLAHIPQTWLSKPWFWVVASLSFGVNLLGVATTPFIAERQTAPLSLYLKLAKEGALALNPSGFMAPSSERRWRWAAMAKDGTGAFNLGETLGLQGWWSLLPWLLVVVILMVVFVYIVKPRGDQDEHRNRGSLSVAFILEFFSLQMLKNTIKSSISFRTKRGQGGVLRIASAALFFFSLLLLRFQVVQDLGTGVRQAFHQGLITGIFADFFLTLLVLAGAWCAAWMVVPELFWLAFIALGVVVWSAEIAGVLYYSFFGEPLEWWIVVRQSAEIPLIVDSALALGRTPFIVGSALLLLSSLGLSGFFLLRAWRIWRKSASPPTEESPIPAVPAKTSLFPGLLLGMISVLFMNSLASSSAARGLLDESTVTRWWRQASGHDKEASRWPNVRNPAQQLIIFRQLESGTEPQNLLPAAWLQPTVEASSSEGNPWPLARRLSFEPKDIAEMREPLGIPTGAMVNMIVIFVESWRSFEFEHPRLGPLVFPRLRARFAQQATYFPFTYASIYPEASTARGQYSALCSSLPNLGGPPVFLRFTGINVQCLPQLMGNGGYHTVLMSAGANEFHKTKAFFSTHGVQTFVGREYFRQFDDPDRVGTWPQQVLSDRPFLHEALQLLEHPNQEQPIRKPFLAVLATLSSHHPYVGVLPDVDLPGADRDYLGYLATLHYVDEALDLFLSELFSTQLADDTLVALIGDHGIRLPPVESLTKLQQLELISRVPMALITAKPQSSRRIPAPVHQMDLAPILTAIAGVPGKVSWIGRNALLGSGSPWVSSRHDSFAYRLGPHECFGNPNERPRCYHLKPGQDPLFDQNLEETDEVPTLTSFMHRVVKANQRLIQYDLLAPPDAEP